MSAQTQRCERVGRRRWCRVLSVAKFRPNWATIVEEGALGRSAGTPRRVKHAALTGPAPAQERRRDSLPLDDRAGQVEDVSTSDDREVPAARLGTPIGGAERTNAGSENARSHLVVTRGAAAGRPRRRPKLLVSHRAPCGIGIRVGRRIGCAAHPRGRPPQIAPVERQAEVTGFLELHGPSISLASLEAEYPDVARAELAGLKAEYRAEWRQDHAQEQCRLAWLCGGSVWAMDFTHPPYLIDGVFPAILNVRDLASRHQLLWLAVAHEDAATVVEALADLFAAHGPPLVMKCDNGPAFRADLTKRFLLGREVFTLYSPPYCAQYNGGCERANRTLKELTAHVADHAGRRDFWKSDDLLVAQLRATELSRPWGATGPTPEQFWAAHDVLSLDKRKNMWQHLRSEIATVMNQRQLDPTVVLSHYPRAEIERIAAQPVLEQLGLLYITRRRITPAF